MTFAHANRYFGARGSNAHRVLGWASVTRACVVVALWLAVFSAGAASVSEEFEAANRLYAEGKFAEAASAFEKILASGQASAAVYFNLGNAFFKAGHLGRALAAYQQAEQLAPRDPDLRANVQFARKQVQGPTLSATWPERWLGQLKLNEWTWLAMGVLWLWFLLLILQQVLPQTRSALRNYVMLLGLTAGALCLCLFGAWQEHSTPAAIVITPEAAARQAPLAESITAFTAHDGAQLVVLDRKDDWLQVSAGGRNLGWVRRDQVLVRNRGSG